MRGNLATLGLRTPDINLVCVFMSLMFWNPQGAVQYWVHVYILPLNLPRLLLRFVFIGLPGSSQSISAA